MKIYSSSLLAIIIILTILMIVMGWGFSQNQDTKNEDSFNNVQCVQESYTSDVSWYEYFNCPQTKGTYHENNYVCMCTISGFNIGVRDRKRWREYEKEVYSCCDAYDETRYRHPFLLTERNFWDEDNIV